jgi:hypothetical protein
MFTHVQTEGESAILKYRVLAFAVSKANTQYKIAKTQCEKYRVFALLISCFRVFALLTAKAKTRWEVEGENAKQ